MTDLAQTFKQAMGYFSNTLLLEGPDIAMHELRADLNHLAHNGITLSASDVFSLMQAFQVAADVISGAQVMAALHGFEAQEQLAVSLTDGMTGVGNRRAYDQKLKQAQAFVARNPNKKAYVLAGDLAGLKAMNDDIGELYGDRAIVAMNQAADGAARTDEQVFRTGGDETKVIMIVDKDLDPATLLKRWEHDLSDIRVNAPQDGQQFRIKIYQAIVEVSSEDTPDSIAERTGNAINEIKKAIKADRTDLSQAIEMLPANKETALAFDRDLAADQPYDPNAAVA